MHSRNIKWWISALSIIAMASAFADFAIPANEIDSNEIFYGSATSFANPAEVSVDDVIIATPEYKEIKKKKIDRGTGRYWILHSNATDRAHRAISDFAEESDYDLIANAGYLGNLSTPIDATDVTNDVKDLVSD